MATYQDKLRDPRWQKRRLEILNRDKWACVKCFDDTTELHVHHRAYRRGANPWDYPDDVLVTLCAPCHREETDSLDVAVEAIANAFRSKFFSDDLTLIAEAVSGSDVSMSEILASVIVWAIKNDRLAMEATLREASNYLAQVEGGEAGGVVL